jgi:putative membrane protein
MKYFLIRWALTTLAVLVASYVVKGIDHSSFTALAVASLLLGLANAVLKPILMILSLPLLLLTFGLFTIVINSLLLLMVGAVVEGFHVAGWWSAFWGSLVISLVSILLKPLEPDRNPGLHQQNHNPPPPPSDSRGRSDKVIDV